MKTRTKNNMGKTDQRVLTHFLFGYSEKDIAQRLQLSARTVRDCRYKLLKLFKASNINELCYNAAKLGFASSLFANIDQLRKGICFSKLGLREIIVLQLLFEGKSDREIKSTISTQQLEAEDTSSYESIVASVKEKLKIQDEKNVFFSTMVSGYMEICEIELESLDRAKVDKSIGEWLTTGKMIEIPRYTFYKSFKLKTKNAEDLNTEEDESIPSDNMGVAS